MSSSSKKNNQYSAPRHPLYDSWPLPEEALLSRGGGRQIFSRDFILLRLRVKMMLAREIRQKCWELNRSGRDECAAGGERLGGCQRQ